MDGSLSNGRDYNGNVCGSQTNPPGSVVLNCPTGVCDQVYYPRLTEDVSISLAFVAVSAAFDRRIRLSPCLASAFPPVRRLGTLCVPTTTRYAPVRTFIVGQQGPPSLR